MRILVVTGIFPPDVGGPSTYVPQIATALVRGGHEAVVLTLSDEIRSEGDGVLFPVVRIQRRMRKPWRWFRAVQQIMSLGRDADVLFVNGLTLEALCANLLLRRPMVMKVVGDYAWELAQISGWVQDDFETFQRAPYGLRVVMLKALRSLWTRRADRIIVPSHYLARWVAGWGVSERHITVIPNAPDLPPSLRPMTVPLQTDVKVVTVGRLVPWKHVDRVIETIARIDGVGLVIVGDGPEGGHLRALASELGLLHRVYFAGRRDRLETLAIMAACDLFVLNSSYEGLPHVVLEAMSLGLPVVATAAGGTPEVIRDGETGRLVPPLADGVLYAVLSELVASAPLRRELGERARRVVNPTAHRRMLDQSLALLEMVASRQNN